MYVIIIYIIFIYIYVIPSVLQYIFTNTLLLKKQNCKRSNKITAGVETLIKIIDNRHLLLIFQFCYFLLIYKIFIAAIMTHRV